MKKFSDLDKMCGIVIRIREKEEAKESKNKLIKMLEDLLRNEDSQTKKNRLEKEYGMKFCGKEIKFKYEDCKLLVTNIE